MPNTKKSILFFAVISLALIGLPFSVADTTSPNFSNISNEANLVNPNKNTRISLNVSDNGSGVSEVRLAIGERFYYTGSSISTQSSFPQGIEFNGDGTKLYETKNGKIYVHTLSTPYKISTASYTGNNFDTQSSDPQEIEFADDGKILLEAGDGKIYSHTVSTPYDLSTASYTGKSISTESDEPTSVAINNKGTKIYETGETNNEDNKIYSYSLSTAYDLSTAAYTGNNIRTESSSPTGLLFNSKGTKLYETGNSNDKIYSHVLNTKFDIATASYTGNSIQTQSLSPQGIEFNNNETKLYEVGSNEIFSYDSGVEVKSQYNQNLANVQSEKVSLNWSDAGFDGRNELIGYRFIVEDDAGNVNITPIKTFRADGEDPGFSNPVVDGRVDVDDGSTKVKVDISDSSGVSSVIIEEDKDDTKNNYTMNSDSGTYSQTISSSNPGDVVFKIYANDTLDNTGTFQDTVQFQNISVSQNLNTSEINASQPINVSGVAKLLPENVKTSGDYSVMINEGYGFREAKNDILDLGDYSSNFTSHVGGTHKVKVNVTNTNGISGLQTSLFNVSLDISDIKTRFSETDTNRIDVGKNNREINLTAYVSNSTDSNVSQVWADIVSPNSTMNRYYLNNSSFKNSSQTWYKSIDLTTELGDQSGEYNVKYGANTTRGIGSDRPEKSFFVENITLEQNISRKKILVGNNITVSGQVRLQPYGRPLTSKNISIYSDGVFIGNITTNSSGFYSGEVKPVKTAGNLSLISNISYRKIKGFNRTKIQVFNLSANITDSQIVDDGKEGYPDHIFRDESDGNIDLDLKDNISLSSDSPMSLKGISALYEIPTGWNAVNNNSALGEIKTGFWDSNSPDIDIGLDSELGSQIVNLSAKSDSGVKDEDSIEINVWTKSQPKFVDVPETIPRSRDYFPIKIKAADYLKDTEYSGITAELTIDGNSQGTNISNSSGIAVFNWSIKDESVGSYTLGATTKDKPERYINYTGNPAFKSVNILGVMELEDFVGNEDPVYRANSSSKFSTTFTPTITDSTDSGVNNALVNFAISETHLSCNTSGGSCGATYNPSDNIKPGIYNIEGNASKDGFDTLFFNNSIEIRGTLDISQDSERNIYTRGKSYRLNSTVSNEYGQEVNGNVSWILNNTKIAEKEDPTWNPDEKIPIGKKTLIVETNKSFFDYKNSSREIELFGRAEIKNLYPSSSTILPNSNINVTADITDVDSQESVGNIPVEFLVNGSKEDTSTTNSKGEAFFTWTPSRGAYNISAQISDNETLNYNVTVSERSSIVEIDKETILDSFQMTEKEIFRSDLKQKDTTRFKINLSETSNKDQRTPAENVNVNIEINKSETVSCETDQLGYCEVDYNPSDVDIGNLSVEVSTSRSEWDSVDYNSSLLVKGVLFTTIEEPTSDELTRGNSVNLEASTTSSGKQVTVPVNWTFRGNTIANGKKAEWNIPSGTDLGQGELKAKAGGDFYEKSIASSEKEIYGVSSVEITKPDNSSGIGYGENPEVSCKVSNARGIPIERYPVEFTENDSTLDSDKTNSEGEISVRWDVPDRISKYEVGCRISDNSSLSYKTKNDVSTKTYSTVDNIEPVIENTSVTPEVDPEGAAEISFDAFDAVNLDEAWIKVRKPNGIISERIEAVNVAGNTYSTDFSDTSEKGSYTVYMRANDSSGNSAEVLKSFSVDPGGSLSVLNNSVRFQDITYNQGSNSNITVNLTLDEVGNFTNITASSTDSSNIEIKDGVKSCGNLSKSESCSKKFNISAKPDTSPGTEFITFTGNWLSSEGSSSVSGFTEINVERNPQLKVENSSENFIQHGKSKKLSFMIESTGNFRAENVELVENGGTIPKNWSSIINESSSKIRPGNSHEAVLNIETVQGASPSNYSRKLKIKSDNAVEEESRANITIPSDASYSVPSNIETSMIKEKTGQIESIGIENTGNVNYTIKTNLKGDISPLLDSSNIYMEKQSTNQINLSTSQGISSSGNYTVELESYSDNPEYSVENQTSMINLEIVDFKVNLEDLSTVDVEPEDKSSIDYNVTLDGKLRTENLKHRIKINGTEVENKNISLNSGRFYANFTIPEVPDARKHDLKVQITDERKNVKTESMIENRFNIPDFTPPSLKQIQVKGTKPGENTSIIVDAFDNSLEGIDTVQTDINTLNNTFSLKKVSKEKWKANLSVNNSGKFIATISASDGAGNTKQKKKKFRIAKKTNISSGMSSWDNPQSVNMSFKDSFTGEKVSEIRNADNTLSVRNLPEGEYNISVEYRDHVTDMNGVNITKNTTEILNLDTISSSNAPAPDADKIIKGLGVEALTDVQDGTVTFSYPADGDFSVDNLRVARCPEYNYSRIQCNGDFELYTPDEENINRVNNTISVDVPGFSSFTLFVPAESNGENTNTNEPEAPSSGGGGGSGGSGSITQEDLNQSINNLEESLSEEENKSVKFGSNSISARIQPGETKKVSLSIENTKSTAQTFDFSSSETISKYLRTPGSVTIQAGQSKEVELVLESPASERPNSYSGYLKAQSQEMNTQIPVNINILPPNDELLDLSLTSVFESVKPGEDMKIQVTLNNQGYARNVDVSVDLKLIDPDTNETLATEKTTYAVGTTLTRVINLQTPKNAERKQYEIVGTARYSNLDVPRVANAVTSSRVDSPFWEREIFGITYSMLGIGALTSLLTLLLGYSGYAYHRKKVLKKKRYMENIDLDTIPSGGDRQGYVGKLAEMGKRTFVGIDDLKTHALIAGATGSGKSVTGQVMVEEALQKGTNVIVLDPTAQWTGFLRENEESEMLQLLKEYGLSLDDTQAYDGNIRAVEPDNEKIDITPYLEEDEGGNIIIFSLHKLDSKNIEKFVEKTIQQIFDTNLPEREELETLIVYDEVHRLLEKFGGTGEGLDQIERGAREFRKWGVGMLLLSQVISDFSGEIRANIGTTVQMRTQYDDDLERMKDKFGIDTVKSIAKAEQGSGMLQNSDYNHGRPYFVDFRPLKHSPHRLSDEELDKYEEYNRKIDKMEEKIDEREDQGEEVYELRNKIKLARRNLRKGGFSLIEIYLEELEDDLSQ